MARWRKRRHTQKMSATTNTKVKTGSKKEKTEKKSDPANSLVLTAKLPVPNVVAEDMPRSKTVPVWIKPAAPPPAMAASVHVRKGDMPLTTAAVATTPATTAAGVATVSNRLSSQGT